MLRCRLGLRAVATHCRLVRAGDAEVMQAIPSEQHETRTSKVPVSVWIRLHRHLAALLVKKRVDEQPLLQFFTLSSL